MRIELSDIESGSWWRWTSACSIGWFLGFLVGFVFAGSFEGTMASGPIQSTLAYLTLGVFIGTAVGLMQWLSLRQRLSGIGLWVAASAAGMGIAGGVGYGAAVLTFGYSEGLEDLSGVSGIFGWAVVAAFGGVIAGLLQRRILTRRGIQGDRWVLSSTLGWALSFAACGIINDVFRSIGPASPLLGIAIFFVSLVGGGVVLGAVTSKAAERLT